MWKRMLQLSNGNQNEMRTEDHNETKGRLPASELEDDGIRTATTAVPRIGHAPALLTDFEQIYQSGTVKPPRLAYSILKVADMLNSEHLSGMPPEVKRNALMMALEAGSAKVEEILQDAIVRQRLMNDYEEARLRDLQNFEASVLEQNRALQANLERITTQYMTRMQANLDEVARAQDNFRVWQKRKQQETQRIADAAAYCVPDNNAQAAAGGLNAATGGLKMVLERASSAGGR